MIRLIEIFLEEKGTQFFVDFRIVILFYILYLTFIIYVVLILFQFEEEKREKEKKSHYLNIYLEQPGPKENLFKIDVSVRELNLGSLNLKSLCSNHCISQCYIHNVCKGSLDNKRNLELKTELKA